MPYCFSKLSIRTLRTWSPGGPMSATLPSFLPAATTLSQSAEPLAEAPAAAGDAGPELAAPLGFAAVAPTLVAAELAGPEAGAAAPPQAASVRRLATTTAVWNTRFRIM